MKLRLIAGLTGLTLVTSVSATLITTTVIGAAGKAPAVSSPSAGIVHDSPALSSAARSNAFDYAPLSSAPQPAMFSPPGAASISGVAAWRPIAAPPRGESVKEPAAIAPPAPIVTTVGPRRTLSPLVLGELISACAPTFDASSQAAVVAVETSGDAWALHDNNDDRSYQPTSYPAAVALADAIIATDAKKYGHADFGLDVGVAQINSNNFPGYGINAALMLHPCANLRKSSEMLAHAFTTQYARLHNVAEPARTELAKRATYAIYNSGKPFGDNRYVQKILAALTSPLVQKTLEGTSGFNPVLPNNGGFPAAYAFSPPTEAPTANPAATAASSTNFAHARSNDPDVVSGSSQFAASGPRYQLSGSQFAHRERAAAPEPSATPGIDPATQASDEPIAAP